MDNNNNELEEMYDIFDSLTAIGKFFEVFETKGSKLGIGTGPSVAEFTGVVIDPTPELLSAVHGQFYGKLKELAKKVAKIRPPQIKDDDKDNDCTCDEDDDYEEATIPLSDEAFKLATDPIQDSIVMLPGDVIDGLAFILNKHPKGDLGVVFLNKATGDMHHARVSLVEGRIVTTPDNDEGQEDLDEFIALNRQTIMEEIRFAAVPPNYSLADVENSLADVEKIVSNFEQLINQKAVLRELPDDIKPDLNAEEDIVAIEPHLKINNLQPQQTEFEKGKYRKAEELYTFTVNGMPFVTFEEEVYSWQLIDLLGFTGPQRHNVALYAVTDKCLVPAPDNTSLQKYNTFVTIATNGMYPFWIGDHKYYSSSDTSTVSNLLACAQYDMDKYELDHVSGIRINRHGRVNLCNEFYSPKFKLVELEVGDLDKSMKEISIGIIDILRNQE